MDPASDTLMGELTDTLAEGIAAVMAAEAQLAVPEEVPPEEMADLFLEELNRLWAEPAPEALSA